jgi:distribution and morphology protein 10
MSQHAQYLVREFLEATRWNAWDNHYGTLTQPSRQLLDFAVPVGAVLTTASRPTRSLAPSLTLASLVPPARAGDDEQGAGGTTQGPTYPPTPAPTLGAPVDPLLAGQLAYLFTSAPLDHRSSKRAATGADRIDFKHVVQSYPLGHLPVRPELRDDARPTWHGGHRTVSPGIQMVLLSSRGTEVDGCAAKQTTCCTVDCMLRLRASTLFTSAASRPPCKVSSRSSPSRVRPRHPL